MCLLAAGLQVKKITMHDVRRMGDTYTSVGNILIMQCAGQDPFLHALVMCLLGHPQSCPISCLSGTVTSNLHAISGVA